MPEVFCSCMRFAGTRCLITIVLIGSFARAVAAEIVYTPVDETEVTVQCLVDLFFLFQAPNNLR